MEWILLSYIQDGRVEEDNGQSLPKIQDPVWILEREEKFSKKVT